MVLKPYYNKDINIFAETNFRDQRKKFGIKREDRRRHMYVVGKTGMGKTAMIKHMIVQDIKAGEGICVVDSSGSLVRELLYYVPKDRVRDVIFFNPADISYPVGFNVLGSVANDLERQEVIWALISMFKNVWQDVWGPRLEYLFTAVLESLLYNPEHTLLHCMPLLTDPAFRQSVLEGIDNPVILDFWHKEFEESKERLQQVAIYPLMDKMRQIMSNPLMRNIIGQTKTSFDFDDILDKKRIVLVLLDQTKIGAEASRLLGTAFIAKLAQRVKRAQNDPRDFYLYVDELQHFVNIQLRELAGTSQYGMNLILVNQYIAQLPSYMREAIFGNVGTIVAFRTGVEDASILADEFSPSVKEETLLALPQKTIVVKLSIDGQTHDAFTAVTMEPLPLVGLADTIIAYSRETYGKRKEVVEKQIMEGLRMKQEPENVVNSEANEVPMEEYAKGETAVIDERALAEFRQKLDSTILAAQKPLKNRIGEYKEVVAGEEVSF